MDPTQIFQTKNLPPFFSPLDEVGDLSSLTGMQNSVLKLILKKISKIFVFSEPLGIVQLFHDQTWLGSSLICLANFFHKQSIERETKFNASHVLI